MMRLYYSVTSPYARKVRIVLAERKIPFEDNPVPQADDPAVTALNPNRKVPTLVHDGRVLFESNLILDYLLQQSAPTAGDAAPPLAEALTRPDHHWDDLLTLTTIESLMDAALILFFAQRQNVTHEQFPQLVRESRRVTGELDWLEERATPEGFIPGRFSIQDVNLVCALEWFERTGHVAWRGRPKLEATLARYAARPSVVSTRP